MNIPKQGEITGTAMTTNNNHDDGAGLRNQQTSTTSKDFTPVQNAVLHFLKAATSMTGYSVTDISEQFSENQLKQALEFLSGEGHIYSATYDGHYRAVSS
ncbi:unnamed protein product [Rotaria sp. Silwood2]|nr:unnamed protein product [Rotaria sp. Silwood2]CAF3033500.1 unnamed protein product [Rotaria sp. Silwood2]CAF4093907.1 unnamed protein product [Rotaria sp. Silwood2]CAF4199111.1 unnamed protein product [Rotaria sp. Silwood2]CAF4409259.1 unnamed protein product [Rotaria sp. Silwood2]